MFFFDFEFFGRDTELLELERLYQQRGFKFAVVYGRRRVGKSTAIQKFIDSNSKPCISFMAIEQNDKQNLEGFSEAILKKYDAAKSYLSSFDSWDKAFDYIISQAGQEQLIIYVDEYPYLANANKALSSILQRLIDGAFKSTNIMLILCGSSMSFMENQVLDVKSPLYGRRDMQFKIEPFDYYDSSRFFDNWSNYEKAVAYAVTGGIPLYLNKLKNQGSLSNGIINEFLKKNGSLYEEPRNLLLQELREPAIYNVIIKAIANGASKPNEISTKTGEESKKIGKYLNSLISLHLVKKETPICGKQDRNSIYRLSDNMFKFWYRFILENNMNIESGLSDYVYNNKILPQLSDYMGNIFEDICIQFLKRKNKKLQLPIVFDNIGRWWGNNPIEKRQEEIDLIATTENKAIFGECKWKEQVGLDVLTDLKRKAAMFKQFEKQYYCIFAKGEFSKALKEFALENHNVLLFTLNDLFLE